MPSTSGDEENHVAFCVALLRPKMPELATVIERWEALPEPIRRAILALVEAGQGKGV